MGLMAITDAGVTTEFYVAYAAFEGADTDAEVIQFVSIFIGQFVDKGALFNRGFIHVGHGFSDHFGCFITGDITVALEILAVNALNDTGISEFYDGFVSPAVRRDVDKGIGCKRTSRTDRQGSHQSRSKFCLHHEKFLLVFTIVNPGFPKYRCRRVVLVSSLSAIPGQTSCTAYIYLHGQYTKKRL